MVKFEFLSVCLLLLGVLAVTVFARVVEDLGMEAVVIAASPSDRLSSRRERKLLTAFNPRLGGSDLPRNCTTKEGVPGTCLTVNECYPRRKIFRLASHETWAMGLYNTCKLESSLGLQVYATCCPNSRSPASTSPASTAVEKKDPPVKRKVSCLLSNSQKKRIRATRCYTDNRRLAADNFTRIVGGVVVQAHSLKFVAALLTENFPGGDKRQFCGGSLIDEYHILTAAHCVVSYRERDVERLIVHLGAHDVHDTSGSSTHHVDRIIRHINFNSRTMDNDVAILTLRTPAPLGNSRIATVCLPDIQDSYENRTAYVAGWGAVRSSGPQPSKLNVVDVSVWNSQVCSDSYGPDAPGGITTRMLCASLPGKDSCQGDSGGALFTTMRGSKDDYTQIGVVSWGISCANPKYPGVYTRVTEMKNWIRRITYCY